MAWPPTPTRSPPLDLDHTARALLDVAHPAEKVDAWREALREELLAASAEVDAGDFEDLGARDVRLLVDGYDAQVFDGLLGELIDHHGAQLDTRVSRRLTSSAGCTRRKRSRRGGPDRYDVAVSAPLLFGTFRGESREVSVAGLACRDRLDALLFVLEHELVHLLEMLVWDRSSCRQARFGQLATGLFAHREATHRLVTPRELAARDLGVRPGSVVAFERGGRDLVGLVARITRRATVLVPDESGRLYTDGRRYARYYVPLDELRIRRLHAGART